MHGKIFWWALLVSLCGIVLSAYFAEESDQRPLITFIAGLTPLVFYHLALAFGARKTLSQDAIDSVYYFGFLITIATLAVSILLLSARHAGTAENLSKVVWVVVSQFGLGLVATGYALFARMHLITIASPASDVDPIALAEDYAQRVQGVAERLTISAVGFETFATTITEKNREIVEISTKTLESLSVDVAKRLQADMASVLDKIKASLDVLPQTMKNATLSSELDTLKSQLRSLGGSVSNVSAQMKTLQGCAGLIENDFTALSTTSAHLQKAIDKSLPTLEQIPSMMQQFVGLSTVTQELCKQIELIKEKLVVLSDEVSKSSREMDKSHADTAASLKQSAKDAAEAVALLTGDLAKMVEYIIEETRGGNPTS